MKHFKIMLYLNYHHFNRSGELLENFPDIICFQSKIPKQKETNKQNYIVLRCGIPYIPIQRNGKMFPKTWQSISKHSTLLGNEYNTRKHHVSLPQEDSSF